MRAESSPLETPSQPECHRLATADLNSHLEVQRMTPKPCYCSMGTKIGPEKPVQPESQAKQPAVRLLRVCGTNRAFKSGSICPSSDLILCNASHATVLLSMSLNPCTSKEQSKSSKTA